MSNEIKKALTFRAASIGDCLMAAYLLNNIHAQYPEARLGIMVSMRGAMIRELLADYPHIEVIEANRRSLASLWRLWRQWRGSDCIITQYAGKHGGALSLPTKLMARLLAKKLVGFEDSFSGNRVLYDALVPVRPDWPVAEHERAALRAAGLAVPLPYPTYTPAAAPAPYVAAPYIVLHAFAGNKGRSLAPARARELMHEIAVAFPHVPIVVTGGAADAPQVEQIVEGTGATPVVGASLGSVAALLGRARGVISVDTGVAHMAAQMGKPVVVLATCLGPNWWYPEQYGPKARLIFMTNPVHTAQQHEYVDYPPCLNGVDMHTAAQRLLAIVGV